MKYLDEMLAARLVQETQALAPQLAEWRRHLHENPEVGFGTADTEAFVREKLREAGIELLDARLGVLGVIRAPHADGMVGLRADMDALPMEELNDVPYCSKRKGAMHACGHDGHTAMLLGAAMVLQAHRAQLRKDVLLVFQPAEEGPDLGGARRILPDLEEKGILPKLEAMFALHLTTEYALGSAGILCGSVMASTDELDITITGLGGHAGMPHQCIDALSLGARYVTEMESFMARRIDPFEPAVFAIGTFHAGTVRNVVPERAELTVTLRCQSEATRAFILDGAQKVLHGLCSAAGARGEAVIRHGLPVLVTDEQQELYAEALAGELGLAPVRPKHGQMGAEDFAYFAQKVPSAFVWLGARNEEKGFTHLLHDPRFDFDEAALPLGACLHCAFALGK